MNGGDIKDTMNDFLSGEQLKTFHNQNELITSFQKERTRLKGWCLHPIAAMCFQEHFMKRKQAY